MKSSKKLLSLSVVLILVLSIASTVSGVADKPILQSKKYTGNTELGASESKVSAVVWDKNNHKGIGCLLWLFIYSKV